MEEIHEEIKEAVRQLETYKNRYRTMNTQDVIDMLKRLNENVKLTIPDVVSSFNLEIKDRDIATIEAMHDILLDEKILGLNARSMKESRALTQRMYKALSKD